MEGNVNVGVVYRLELEADRDGRRIHEECEFDRLLNALDFAGRWRANLASSEFSNVMTRITKRTTMTEVVCEWE